MKAFLTGSHVYGYPDSDSDVDLVIFCSQEDKNTLINLSETCKMPCKYGDLNLIFCTTPEQYQAWFDATKECKKRGPVTHTEANAIHEKHRNALGVTFDHHSGENQ